jgi:hypothetical protein
VDLSDNADVLEILDENRSAAWREQMGRDG